MHVLVAPDDFKGTLTAVQAARAIAMGWLRTAPADELDLCPMSDGGPGFVDTLHAALGGELLAVSVTGPLGQPVPATLLAIDGVVYVESAQACGLTLIPEQRRDPKVTSTFGVGQLLSRAIEVGAKKIVIGVGGTGTNDGGAGLLAALGASANADLAGGGAALRGVTSVDVDAARERLSRVDLVVASDVEAPLLGINGATRTFGPQKGASEEDVMLLEGALTDFVAAVGRGRDGKNPAVALGAGAGGGLGYALMHLGAKRESGFGVVRNAVGLIERISRADVVITGEGAFDWSSLRGKVCAGVSMAAMEQARPCVVLAGDAVVGKREYCAIGVTEAHSMSEIAGSIPAAIATAEPTLTELAARTAAKWSIQARG